MKHPAPLVRLALAVAGCVPALVLHAADAPGVPLVLHVDAAKVTAHVSPTLYGLMTEEINYSYDGGLYAELVRNRTFQDDPAAPAHWSLVQEGGGAGAITLDRSQPLNAILPVSLKFETTALSGNQRVGVANDGFWGIPVRAHTRYQASFYAKAAAGFPVRSSSRSRATTAPPSSPGRRSPTWAATGRSTPSI